MEVVPRASNTKNATNMAREKRQPFTPFPFVGKRTRGRRTPAPWRGCCRSWAGSSFTSGNSTSAITQIVWRSAAARASDAFETASPGLPVVSTRESGSPESPYATARDTQ